MKFRTPEIEVPEHNPFQNDKLNREPAATVLTNLLRSIQPPGVIGLNAPWGYGKTTFLRMWRRSMTNDQLRVLYFNAWKSDYLNDPVLAILNELEDNLETDEGREQLQKAKRIAGKLAFDVARIAAKVVTVGAIDLKSDAIEEAVEDGFSGLIDSYADGYVKSYEEAKKSTNALRENLGEFVKSAEPEAEQPVVVLVDELDRCRPEYALLMLERIKHVFNVDGLVFVLAMDKQAICSVIRTKYGTEFRAADYLRRFVDLELNLPIPKYEEYATMIAEDIHVNNKYVSQEDLCRLLSSLGKALPVSLRQTKRIVDQLQFVAAAFPWFRQERDHHKTLFLALILLFIEETWTNGVAAFEKNPQGACGELLQTLVNANVDKQDGVMIMSAISSGFEVSISDEEIGLLGADAAPDYIWRQERDARDMPRVLRDVREAITLERQMSERDSANRFRAYFVRKNKD